jgi:hypothetical protein
LVSSFLARRRASLAALAATGWRLASASLAVSPPRLASEWTPDAVGARAGIWGWRHAGGGAPALTKGLRKLPRAAAAATEFGKIPVFLCGEAALATLGRRSSRQLPPEGCEAGTRIGIAEASSSSGHARCAISI